MLYAELLLMESNQFSYYYVVGRKRWCALWNPFQRGKLQKMDQFIHLLKRSLGWESERPKTSCQLCLWLNVWPWVMLLNSVVLNFINRKIKDLNKMAPYHCKILFITPAIGSPDHSLLPQRYTCLRNSCVPGLQGDGKPELRFVLSALFQVGSKFAHCTESWASTHITGKDRWQQTNLLTFKKTPVWLPQQSSGRDLCPEELRQVKNPQAAVLRHWRFSMFRPCPKRAVTWLLSNCPSPPGSLGNKPLGEVLAFSCSCSWPIRGQGAFVKIWEKGIPNQNLEETYFLSLVESQSDGGFEWCV